MSITLTPLIKLKFLEGEPNKLASNVTPSGIPETNILKFIRSPTSLILER